MSEEKTVDTNATAVELTLQDLSALRSVIDVASQRGAFKAGEMAAVGTVYNKLSGFLDAVEKQAKASQEAQAAQPKEEV
jgi:hypothetical protein